MSEFGGPDFASGALEKQYVESAAAVAPPPKPIRVNDSFVNMTVLEAAYNSEQVLYPVGDYADVTLRNRRVVDIAPRITKMSLALSGSEQSQLTIELEDPDFRLLGSKVFQGQPHVNYKGLRLELAGVATIDRGRGAIRLGARSEKVQALKRRRGPLTVQGDERSFIGYECDQVGLPFVTVPDTAAPTLGPRMVSRDWQPYTQLSSVVDADEIPSSWTTFKRLASQRGWMLFEAHNVLYFAPMSWLFVNSTIVRVRYSPDAAARKRKFSPTARDKSTRAVVVDASGAQYWKTLVASGNYEPGIIETTTIPEFDHSSDRVETTVTFKIDAGDVGHFVPGKVVDIQGVPGFAGLYLCMSVGYDLDGNDATITAQTPVDPQPQGGSTFGGFSQANSPTTSLGGLDTSGSDSAALGLPSCGINMASFLHAMRIVESTDRNVSPSSADGASGYYQYEGATWRSVAPPATVAKYPQAYLAPKDIQTQVAETDVSAKMQTYGDDWGKVAADHLYPKTANKPHLWKYRPYMEPGASLPYSGYDPRVNPPVIEYVRNVLKKAGGVSCHQYAATKLSHDFVAAALTQVGKPYEQTVRINYETTANPGVFDCSSLVQWACAQVGITDMPRNSGDQWAHCESDALLGLSVAQPYDIASALKIRGALLWIDGGGRAGGEHVAISMGDGHRELAAHTSHAPLAQQINVRETTAGAWNRAALIPGMTYPPIR